MTDPLLKRVQGRSVTVASQATFDPDGGPLPTDLSYQPRSLANHVAWINDRAAWLEGKDPTGQRRLDRWRLTVRNGVNSCEPIVLIGTPDFRRQAAIAKRAAAR